MTLLLPPLQVKERRESEPEKLNHLVKKLLIIIGRVARLLEIMVRREGGGGGGGGESCLSLCVLSLCV